MQKTHHRFAIASLAFFSVFALNVYAQDPGLPAAAKNAGAANSRYAAAQTSAGFQNRLERAVGLSAEQKETVRGLLAQQRQDLQALREQMEPKYNAVREGTDAKIRALLNAEQQKKFDAFLAKMKQDRKARSRRTS